MRSTDGFRVPGPRNHFGEPLGPWTALHTLGAAVVLLIALGIGLAIWPGWPQLRQWAGA